MKRINTSASISIAVLSVMLTWSGPARADCVSDEAAIRQMMARLQSATGLGLCETARQSAQLYREAARWHRTCVNSPTGQAQAAEYDRAAVQASTTASAACR